MARLDFGQMPFFCAVPMSICAARERAGAQCGIRVLEPLQNSHTGPDVFKNPCFFVASRGVLIIVNATGDVAPQTRLRVTSLKNQIRLVRDCLLYTSPSPR